MTVFRKLALAVSLAALLAGPPAVRATAVEDAYLTGYATALLERQFEIRSARVVVKDGAVVVVSDAIPDGSTEKVIAALRSIPGVVAVELRAPDEGEETGAEPDPEPPRRAEPETGGVAAAAERPSSVFLPKDKLFQPLLADPRWPHFSVSYHVYIDDPELDGVGSANFGETFPIYRSDLGPGRWEVGMQAGVFSIFDMDSASKDLVNADYWVGLPIVYRVGGFSVLGRLFHQSSHLGDEYLLRNREGDRVNLSYEQWDLKLSQEIGGWLRLYGGGGWLFDQEPSDLDRWSTQGGVELTSPWTMLQGAVRPIAAVDVQHREETEWNTDVSLRYGFQLESPVLASTRVQLLGEYYDGHSPNGQFFERRIRFAGLGAHVYF